MPGSKRTPPKVRLGRLAANGIAPSVYGLVELGAGKRPSLARSLRGTVEFRFAEGFAPVRVSFEDDGVLVEDRPGRPGRRSTDVLIRGSLPDIVQLAAAPLVGGVPKPTSARGRAALIRFANRKVRIEGSSRLARRLLQLMQL